jgi:predicted O-methyltransferase YrrM
MSELFENLRKASIECRGLEDEFLNELFEQDPLCHYYRFVYFLLREIKAPLSVELGVCTGRCTAHMAAARSEGKVIGIDTALRDLSYITDRYPNIALWECRSDDPAAITRVGERSVDLLLVDTVHSYNYVMKETTMWLSRMKPGGIILYDDLLLNDSMKHVMPKLPFIHKGYLDGLHNFGFGYAVCSP